MCPTKEKILSLQEVEENLRVSALILVTSLRVNPLFDLSVVRFSNDGKLRMD